MAPYLRFGFAGSDAMERNYSQAWQDIFVLMAHRGKAGGTYLEIGAHVPIENNNTFLLQTSYGWTGVSIELDTAHLPSWIRDRPDGQLLIADALAIDYAEALPLWFDSALKRVDYLQLDIDPSINTLAVLKRLPLDEWRFSLITLETDAYAGDHRARDESRAILSDHGYVPIARDIAVLFAPVSAVPIPFEDWWADPAAIGPEVIDGLRSASAESSLPQHFLFRS
jgi:hypothetical protein